MRRFELALMLALMLGSSLPAPAGEGEPSTAPVQPSADVLTLADGRKISGRIVGEDEKFVSIESGGTTRAYARDAITSIERAPRPAPGSESAAGTAPDAPPARDKKGPKPDRADKPLSEAAKAWLHALIAKSAEDDETVRKSVASAITALGRPAIPALRSAAEAAADGPQRQFLTRLAESLESQRDRKMRGDGADGPMPGADGPGRKALGGILARVSEQLALRDEQKPKVEAVLQDVFRRRAQIQRAAAAEGLTAEQVAEKVAALKTELLAQMKTILDETQYARFEETAARLVEAPRGPMPPKGADTGGAPPSPPPGGDAPK
jgi:hypothetical protein